MIRLVIGDCTFVSLTLNSSCVITRKRSGASSLVRNIRIWLLVVLRG